MEIVERHSHSLDLYDEQTRYTPLGSDATVVYGYKDLRIKNNLPFPIRFSFRIDEHQMIILLWSEKPIVTKRVEFKKWERENEELEVQTFVDNEQRVRSIYKKEKNIL